MNTPEILEKLELHMLRVQRMLQQTQNYTLHTADAEKICNELRQAYELSVVLKHHQPTVPSAIVPPVMPIVETVPEPVIAPPAQPVVETILPPKEEPVINLPVAEVPPAPTPVAPPPPVPELKKEPVIPVMTVAEAKVTFNDQKADAVKEALADKLALSKIADLTKAIALHEKFLFINELFQGDNVPYNAFIEKVNQLQTLDDALIIVNDYAGTYHWDFESKTFQKMLIYIQRRHA